jgi:hypothetical protein
MKEQRQQSRMAFDRDVNVKLYAVDGQKAEILSVQGRTADISENGMSLVLSAPVQTGATLKLRVAIADPPCAFIHDAIVRWTHPMESPPLCWAGVEFTGASKSHMDEWRSQVRSIVQRRSPGRA